jgi:hypothetical protein
VLIIPKKPHEIHMSRRIFFRVFWIGAIALLSILCWSTRNRDASKPHQRDDWERRLTFVICDDHGSFSSGIYQRIGGGRAAFDDLREAAQFMRWNDPGSSAAGLCGFLMKRGGYNLATGGMISIDSPPQPGPDGVIDWKTYAGNQDLIVINVDKGSAKCLAGQMEGEEIHGLRLGGHKMP